MGMWTLPRPLLILGAVQRLTALVRLFRAARPFRWEEGKYVIKLRALHHQLQLQRFEGYRVVVLDEGPVYALSWLHADAHQTVTNGGLASWWPRALKQWAKAVDVIVLLDAPDPVLARRIRTRPHDHPVKDRSDAEISEFLGRQRAANARVLSDLRAQSGPGVVSFRTDQGSPAQIAEQLLAEFQRERHGR